VNEPQHNFNDYSFFIFILYRNINRIIIIILLLVHFLVDVLGWSGKLLLFVENWLIYYTLLNSDVIYIYRNLRNSLKSEFIVYSYCYYHNSFSNFISALKNKICCLTVHISSFFGKIIILFKSHIYIWIFDSLRLFSTIQDQMMIEFHW
jgi:hypothetical protein